MDGEPRYSRWQRLFVGLAVACVIGIAGVVAGAGIVVGWLLYEHAPPSERTLAKLKGEGTEIVVQLEAYKALNGTYPPELESAEISVPTHDFGKWQYHTWGDRSGFQLWIPTGSNSALQYDSGWGEFVESND